MEANSIETSKKETKKRNRLELWVGIILLIPPILSVLFFILKLTGGDPLHTFDYSSEWTGSYGYSDKGGGGGGYTSALPFYFGLMAIAGALLISNSTKK